MNTDKIKCPSCGESIPITEALTANLKNEFSSDYKLKLEAEKKAIEVSLRKEFESKQSLQFDLLKAEKESAEAKLKKAHKNELELRKIAIELKQKEESMDLELQRRVDEAVKISREQIVQKTSEEAKNKIAEKDLIIKKLEKNIGDLKIKAEQGSQQVQGESFQIQLEDQLLSMFSTDEIEPVGKGRNGADVIQRVCTSSGKVAGTIYWECKNTKSWDPKWVPKLKDDQRELSAEIAAIVSTVLPDGIKYFDELDGVWITSPITACAMATMLRDQILKVYQARVANLIPNDQKESVFRYLTGTKFKQSIEGEIDIIGRLLEDLSKERKTLNKNLATRETQLNHLMTFKAALYGDLQGILGKSLQPISQLELMAPEDEIILTSSDDELIGSDEEVESLLKNLNKPKKKARKV